MTTGWQQDPSQRVALVTGGSRGVGKAVVQRLASRGYPVVVNYAKDQWSAESTVDLVLDAHGIAVAIRADVRDELDVARLFGETIHEFGGVDIVVHTVGDWDATRPSAEMSLDEFDSLWQINTRATFLVGRQAARDLRPAGTVVVLSGSGDSTTPSAEALWAATTAASDVLTRSLAAQLQYRSISVSGLSLDVDQPCAPDAIAQVVVYLATDGARTLNGQVLRVDDPRLGI